MTLNQTEINASAALYSRLETVFSPRLQLTPPPATGTKKHYKWSHLAKALHDQLEEGKVPDAVHEVASPPMSSCSECSDEDGAEPRNCGTDFSGAKNALPMGGLMIVGSDRAIPELSEPPLSLQWNSLF